MKDKEAITDEINLLLGSVFSRESCWIIHHSMSKKDLAKLLHDVEHNRKIRSDMDKLGA